MAGHVESRYGGYTRFELELEVCCHTPMLPTYSALLYLSERMRAQRQQLLHVYAIVVLLHHPGRVVHVLASPFPPPSLRSNPNREADCRETSLSNVCPIRSTSTTLPRKSC